MKTNKSQVILQKMMMIAIFAGLSFAGTFFNAAFSTGGFIHLGNFFCILGSILCGGLVGGLSGSLGMGLYDLLFYPSTLLRTLIAKFLMGFITSLIFRFIVKKNKNPNIAVYCLFGISFIFFVFTLVIYFVPSVHTLVNANQEAILNHGKEVVFNISSSITLIVFAGIFLFLTTLMLVLSRKTPSFIKAVTLATTVGCMLNMLVEFIFRIVENIILSATFTSSFLYAIYRIPASALTSIITIVLVSTIYLPLYEATHKMNRLNDLEGIIQLNKRESNKM